jgi:hypothetical protein
LGSRDPRPLTSGRAHAGNRGKGERPHAILRGTAQPGIIALVGDVLDDMTKSKETPPAPLSLQQFKGNIAVRVPPERHRELVMEAAEAGVSLNRLISDKLAH